MNSRTTSNFRTLFAKLPLQVQKQAREAFRLFESNPYHTSLRFKQVHSAQPIFSARIGLDYRAVGLRDGGDIVWYWIGSHAGYDKLLESFRG